MASKTSELSFRYLELPSNPLVRPRSQIHRKCHPLEEKLMDVECSDNPGHREVEGKESNGLRGVRFAVCLVGDFIEASWNRCCVPFGAGCSMSHSCADELNSRLMILPALLQPSRAWMMQDTIARQSGACLEASMDAHQWSISLPVQPSGENEESGFTCHATCHGSGLKNRPRDRSCECSRAEAALKRDCQPLTSSCLHPPPQLLKTNFITRIHISSLKMTTI